MVFRPHIVEVWGVPTATTSLCSLAVVPPPWAPSPALATPPPDRVTSVSNRQRPHHGGTHERRVRRASAAMALRLAGRSVKQICSALSRTAASFHTWLRRHL